VRTPISPHFFLLAIVYFGCTKDDGEPDASPTSEALCVWNQAYQENYASDSVSSILSGAAGCYVLIDPFASMEARNAIPEMKNGGNTIGCYISTGTCEDWRDDFDQIRPYCISTAWDEWPGEYFVDTPNDALIALMELRIDSLAAWGCDMVEFDNMDWAFDDAAQSKYGFAATAEQAMAYNQALCDYTAAKGMGCMAKNTRVGASTFDGVTFESYSDSKDWWDPAELSGFLDDGALGIVVHYDETDCDGVYAQYMSSYGPGLSYICEDRDRQGYRHYNQ
jgi:cysteinyl-tRNA synthetase